MHYLEASSRYAKKKTGKKITQNKISYTICACQESNNPTYTYSNTVHPWQIQNNTVYNKDIHVYTKTSN